MVKISKLDTKARNVQLVKHLMMKTIASTLALTFMNKNLYESSLKLDFDCIESNNHKTVTRVIDIVCELWELRDGANHMKQ